VVESSRPARMNLSAPSRSVSARISTALGWVEAMAELLAASAFIMLARRAGGAESVSHENAQAAHGAERHPAEVGRPDQFLEHEAAAETDAVKKKSGVDRRQLLGCDRQAQAEGLDDEHHRARMADFDALAEKAPDQSGAELGGC